MSEVAELLTHHEAEILDNWMSELKSIGRSDLIGDQELRTQSADLLKSIATASKSGNISDFSRSEWTSTRELVNSISSSRAKQGFTASETATFVLSLKRPIFRVIQTEQAKNAPELAKQIWAATTLIDGLALISTEAFLTTKERLIARQQEELLELSTPVVKLWDGILALPIIGTLDSARTQTVMESLLQAIVETNSKIAIIDITGVPTVDTLVAQHLIKTITAARLMGAECFLSGIRPQIAQTIIHLGIELTDVITKAKLADAFALALQKTGRTIVKIGAKPQPAQNS